MEVYSDLFYNLSNKFEKCIILSLSNRQDRRDYLEHQLYGMGFPQVGSTNFMKYHYATPFPFNGLIAKAFNESKLGRFTKANEYDCARSHYSIIKECYDLGYKNCLILEDDLRFLKNQDQFNYFINNIPNDFDILQFGGFTTDPKAISILDKYSNGEYWVKHPNVFLWNASMYALSRKGMEYYLAFMNKLFTVADMPLYKAPLNSKLINTYASTIPLVIQADKDIITSDIRNKQNDSIDYKTMNVYESRIKNSDYLE